MNPLRDSEGSELGAGGGAEECPAHLLIPILTPLSQISCINQGHVIGAGQ